MESTELATILDAQPLAASNDISESFMSTSTFLPRIQLMTDRSPLVAADKFQKNHFALIKGDEYRDLGPSVDCIVLARRSKALDTSDKSNIVTVYDAKPDERGNPTGEFRRIMEDSETQDSGCMYGPEFLVWLGGNVAQFATLFFGSKSHRREASSMNGLLRQAATLTPFYVEGKKFKWWVPRVTMCSTPVMPLPELEDTKQQLNDFLNPKDSTVRRVEEVAGSERAR